jgi:alkyl sulfatase BDS1-like metallo-beta-lactamase superfamily hydrolase
MGKTGAEKLMPGAVLNNIVLGETTLDKAIEAGKVTVQGKKESLSELVAMLDKFDFWFNIVTPNRSAIGRAKVGSDGRPPKPDALCAP